MGELHEPVLERVARRAPARESRVAQDPDTLAVLDLAIVRQRRELCDLRVREAGEAEA